MYIFFILCINLHPLFENPLNLMKFPYKAVYCVCKAAAACVWLSWLVVFLYPKVLYLILPKKIRKVKFCVSTPWRCVRVASLILNICSDVGQ